MNIQHAINNLVLTSEILEREANKPQNYNTEWAYYLEKMSWQMHKNANELRDFETILTWTQSTNSVNPKPGK